MIGGRPDKIIMLGDSGVGKTSTIERFINGCMPKIESPTIGAGYSEISYQDKKVQIWDTAGQERFRSMIPIYARNASGAFVVFSLSSKESFNSIPSWISTINSVSQGAKIVIIGNKSDLRDRQVSDHEISSLVSKYDAEYIETSSVTGEGINDVFTTMLSKIFDNSSVDIETIPTVNTTLKKDKSRSNCC